MPSIRSCDFCGSPMEPGTGMLFASNDGRVSYFCSSKCDKNSKLGRKPRKLPWTVRGREVRQRMATKNEQTPPKKPVEVNLDVIEE
jgi:large subunit ribosomal protein L24e